MLNNFGPVLLLHEDHFAHFVCYPALYIVADLPE